MLPMMTTATFSRLMMTTPTFLSSLLLLLLHATLLACGLEPCGPSHNHRPWACVALGSCEHAVEAGITYGAEVADKVPEAYRASWSSNDVNSKAPGQPQYGGYGWRFCGDFSPGSDVTNPCERFCDALGDCVAVSAGQCCFPYKQHCAQSQLSDRSKSQSYRYYERADDTGAWGWWFVALVVLGGGLYVGVGAVLGARRRRRGQAPPPPGGRRGGLAAHPHYGWWRSVALLVVDGIAFVRGSGGGAARIIASARTTAVDESVSAGLLSPGSKKSNKKLGKKSGKVKKQTSKGHKNRADGRQRQAKTPSAASVIATQEPVKETWQPTRTGHLAVGARETGVKVQM
jgi:hypothetical protein